jgi:hypothetical protein
MANFVSTFHLWTFNYFKTIFFALLIPQWVIIVNISSTSEKSLDLDKACLVNLVLNIWNSLGILTFKTRRQLGKFECASL